MGDKCKYVDNSGIRIASKSLGCVRRSLVSHLGYATQVWSPQTVDLIIRVERVQCRANKAILNLPFQTTIIKNGYYLLTCYRYVTDTSTLILPSSLKPQINCDGCWLLVLVREFCSWFLVVVASCQLLLVVVMYYCVVLIVLGHN